MRNIILGIFIIAASLAFANESYAQCSCFPTFYSAYDELKGSDAVFVGEVVEIRKGKAIEDSRYFEFDVTFKVTMAWKTGLSEHITIKNIASGSSEFEDGKTYLVYARIHNKFLKANLGCCNRTKLLSEAAGDLKLFRRKKEKPKDIIKSSSEYKAKPNKSLERRRKYALSSCETYRFLGCLQPRSIQSLESIF